MSSDNDCMPCAELNAIAQANNWPMQCDGTLAFEHPALCDLLALWQAKAAGGIPARTDFDMRVLKPYVPHIFILEQEDEGRRYKFRLFGSALLLLFGEHTGRYLDEMVPADLLPGWQAVYNTVLQARRPLRILTPFRLPSDQFLKGEIFTAPMTDGAGAKRMILAATYVSPRDAVFTPYG